MSKNGKNGIQSSLFGTDEAAVTIELDDIVNHDTSSSVVKESDALAVFDEDALNTRSDLLLFSTTLTLGITSLLVALRLDGRLDSGRAPWAAIVSPVPAVCSFAFLHQFAKLVYTLRTGAYLGRERGRRIERAVGICAAMVLLIVFSALVVGRLDSTAANPFPGSWLAAFSPLLAIQLALIARDIVWYARRTLCPSEKARQKRKLKKKRKKLEAGIKRTARAVLQYPPAIFTIFLALRLDGHLANWTWYQTFAPVFALLPLLVLAMLFQSGKPFLGDTARAVFVLLVVCVPAAVFSVYLCEELEHPTRKRTHMETFSPLYGSCAFLFLGRFFLRFVAPLCCIRSGARFHNID